MGTRVVAPSLAVVVVMCAGCGDDTAESTVASATVEPNAESTAVPATELVVSTSAPAPTVVDTDTSDSSDESEATVTETPDTGPNDKIDRGVQPQIDLAVADLAVRLSVDPSSITIMSAAFVAWPDKGLGCPQHGMQYLQVQVDGTLIELEVDGVRYRYHSGETRPPFLCELTFSADPLRPDDTTLDASG